MTRETIFSKVERICKSAITISMVLSGILGTLTYITVGIMRINSTLNSIPVIEGIANENRKYIEHQVDADLNYYKYKISNKIELQQFEKNKVYLYRNFTFLTDKNKADIEIIQDEMKLLFKPR